MSRTILTVLALSPLLLAGCRSMNHTEGDALAGGGIGAAGGALIGSATGHPVAGAAIGAVAGAATGAAIGNTADERESRAAVASARGRLGMTDIVTLVQQGTDADVIVNQIRTTGSTFTLSTADIQYLTQQNVPAKVITAMQTATPVHGHPTRVIIREEVPVVGPPVIIARPYYYRPYGRCYW